MPRYGHVAELNAVGRGQAIFKKERDEIFLDIVNEMGTVLLRFHGVYTDRRVPQKGRRNKKDWNVEIRKIKMIKIGAMQLITHHNDSPCTFFFYIAKVQNH